MLIDEFLRLLGTSTARFFCGIPPTSARNSSERIEMPGFFKPAAAWRATTRSGAMSRELICRMAWSSSSSGRPSTGARFANAASTN